MFYYIDDIIVFDQTFEITFENVRKDYLSFRTANLKLKPKECHLFKKQVQNLGLVLSDEGISCNPNKIEVVQN